MHWSYVFLALTQRYDMWGESWGIFAFDTLSQYMLTHVIDSNFEVSVLSFLGLFYYEDAILPVYKFPL